MYIVIMNSNKIVFKRKFSGELERWKRESRGTSAILIEGARRIGKSTVAEEFAKANYPAYLIIDFSKQTESFLSYFNDTTNIQKLFDRIFVSYGMSPLPKGSLLIFDEVQFCPKARQAIKPLVVDGRYEYIETGSLISIKENSANILIPSEEEKMEMHPMDYEEFLWATSLTSEADYLKEKFHDSGFDSISENHNQFLKSLRLYLAIGGMPQAVETYLDNHDFLAVERKKKSILSLYEEDLGKIDKKYGTLCKRVYDLIPSLASRQSFKVPLKQLGLDQRTKVFSSTLEKLEESKIVNVAYRTAFPEAGLQAGKEQSFFKIYPNDVGLALSEAYAPTPGETMAHYQQVLEGKLRSNLGYLFETLLEEMLVSLAYRPFYSSWTEKDEKGVVSQYEVDFLIERYGKVQPIECKANAIGKMSSLSLFEKKHRDTSRTGMVVTTKPLAKKDERLWLPFYLVFAAFSKNG